MMGLVRNEQTLLIPFGEKVVLDTNGLTRLQIPGSEDWVTVVSEGDWAISEVRIAADLTVDLIVFLLRKDGGWRYVDFPAEQVWYHNVEMMDFVCGRLNLPRSAYVYIKSRGNRRVRDVVGNVARFDPDVEYDEINDDPSENSETIGYLSDVEETLRERGDLYGDPEDTTVYNAEQVRLAGRCHFATPGL